MNTSQIVDKVLPSDDPTWPPIEVRHVVLKSCPERDLIAWALRLGVTATNKDEAVAGILHCEYSEKKCEQLITDLTRTREEYEARRKPYLERLAQAEKDKLPHRYVPPAPQE